MTPLAGRLILLRHGQSAWNVARRFTGWADPPLTDRGYAEAIAAGRALASAGLLPDVAFTSLLVRAQQSVLGVGAGLGAQIRTQFSWRLNERHYGALEGMRHVDARAAFGTAMVETWRRSWDVRPPLLDPADPRHPSHDRRYCEVAPADLPSAESLADGLGRQLPYIDACVLPAVEEGATVLIVSHGNSLRALVAHFDNVSADRVPSLLIPTGVPRVYRYADGWQRQSETFPVHGTWTGP